MRITNKNKTTKIFRVALQNVTPMPLAMLFSLYPYSKEREVKCMEYNGQQCSTLRTNSNCESDSCNDEGCECPSGQDLLKFGEIMWHKAAMAAMFEAKKDRIKTRLEKSFGPTLDKGADAVVEAIQKKIQTAVASAKTEQELHTKLVSILTEATN